MIRSAQPAPSGGGQQDYVRGTPPPANGSRFLAFDGSSYDATARTVEAVLSSGARVRRWGYFEELAMLPESIDLGRAEAGQVRFLDCHNQWEMDAVLGRVDNVRLEDGRLLGRIHFADTERGRVAEGMASRGELTGISIGYAVRTWTLVEETENYDVWQAARWELLEVSLVPVPADPSAGIRSASGIVPGDEGAAGAEEETEMQTRNQPGGGTAPGIAAAPAAAVTVIEARAEPAAAPAAAATPTITRFTTTTALDFVEQARAFGLDAEARALVTQNEAGTVGAEAARSQLLTLAAERQRAATAPTPGGAVAVVRDSLDASREHVVEALVARTLGRAPTDAARDFMGMRMLELAAQRAGLSARERDPFVILRAAHTSSDFPLILEAAGNRVLLERYNLAVPTYRRIARQRNLTDFKATKLLRIGDFPTLLPYGEDGEIKSGTINEGRESVVLGSFGRILRLSRQAIVNDDLMAFDDVFGSIGTTVAQFENASFYAMKAVNSGNGPKLADNVNLFNSAHGNLAGSGAAMDVTTLGAGRAAIRKQTNIDGKVMNLAPRVLLVGADQETAAEQLTSPLQPQQAGNVNPFSGRLDIVAEGSIAGNAWELYADPAIAPVFNYGYLADAPGPRVMTEESFNVDGMSFRVTLDFYSGAVDYRGAYRNPGA